MRTRVLLALAVLATAFLTWGLGSPRAASKLSRWSPWEAHHPPQDDEHSQAKEFKGKISKMDGRFVLEESSDGGSYGTYLLDDQTTAGKYEGQKVVVTGTLVTPHQTIHVRKIAACTKDCGRGPELVVRFPFIRFQSFIPRRSSAN
jgi:Protein of unknown function (DUF5818)